MIININKLLASRKSIFNAFHNDIRNGRLSKSTGPLEIWKLSDGRLLVVDGYHRLVEAMLKGKKYLNVEVVGEGYTDYWATPNNDDVFAFDNYSQYLGLEGLADETILRSAIGSASDSKIDALEAGLREKYKDVFEPFSSNGSPQFDLISTNVPNAFELKLIVIKKSEQGKGYGGRIMNEIIDFADKNDMIIVLSPSEIKTAKLIKWYKSFDFLENKNRNKDFRFMNRMIRYPNGLTRSKWIDAHPIAEARSRSGDKLNLKQCYEIRENQYRSRDARYDYQPEEIDERILELEANKDQRSMKKFEKEMEQAPNEFFEKYEIAAKLSLQKLSESGFLDPVSKYNLIEYGANEFSQEQLDAFDKLPTLTQNSYRYSMGNPDYTVDKREKEYDAIVDLRNNETATSDSRFHELRFKLTTIPGQRTAMLDLLEKLSDRDTVRVGRVYKPKGDVGESILDAHVIADEKSYKEIKGYLSGYLEMGDKVEIITDKQIDEIPAAAMYPFSKQVNKPTVDRLVVGDKK